MLPILQFEVKYYFKNLKEVFYLYGLFISIVLLQPFSQLEVKQGVGANIIWIALTLMSALGGVTLFQRDHESGRLEYYQTATDGLVGVILAKWFAYYLCVTVPLLATLPVLALLVDIPVDVWSHYGLGLASGAMALTLLVSLIAVVMTGLEKAGAALSLVLLPLVIPIVIFGTSYLADTAHDFQPSLLFLWGFSLFLLPVLCVAGASCIRASN
jgi:heme exporter protein B